MRNIKHLRLLNFLKMGPLDTLIHLLSFVAPALAVAVLVALAARLILPRQPTGLAWWVHIAINSIAGCQWLSGRAWKA